MRPLHCVVNEPARCALGARVDCVARGSVIAHVQCTDSNRLCCHYYRSQLWHRRTVALVYLGRRALPTHYLHISSSSTQHSCYFTIAPGVKPTGVNLE